MCDTDVHHPSMRQQAEEKGAMIDLDEYDRLFQKMEDLFQGLTSVVSIKVVDENDENDIVDNRRRDVHPSSNALADKRDDFDTEFDFLKETEDKIAAELLELSDLMRSASSADDRLTRETAEKLKSNDKGKSKHKRTDSSELDKAIQKQLEEFRVSGGGSKRQTDNKKNQVPGKDTIKQIDAQRPVSSESQDSEDEVHIFHSNSQLDSPDASRHDRSVGTSQFATQEENVEVSIFHGDVEVDIDGSDDMDSERWLKEAYPLEFPGRSPAPPKSARALLLREPSIDSSSSEESSLLWVGEIGEC